MESFRLRMGDMENMPLFDDIDVNDDDAILFVAGDIEPPAELGDEDGADEDSFDETRTLASLSPHFDWGREVRLGSLLGLAVYCFFFAPSN